MSIMQISMTKTLIIIDVLGSVRKENSLTICILGKTGGHQNLAFPLDSRGIDKSKDRRKVKKIETDP